MVFYVRIKYGKHFLKPSLNFAHARGLCTLALVCDRFIINIKWICGWLWFQDSEFHTQPQRVSRILCASTMLPWMKYICGVSYWIHTTTALHRPVCDIDTGINSIHTEQSITPIKLAIWKTICGRGNRQSQHATLGSHLELCLYSDTRRLNWET